MITTSEIAKWRSQHMYFINQNQMNKKKRARGRKQKQDEKSLNNTPHKLKLKRKKHAVVMTTRDYLMMCPEQYFAVGMNFLDMRKSLKEIFIQVFLP